MKNKFAFIAILPSSLPVLIQLKLELNIQPLVKSYLMPFLLGFLSHHFCFESLIHNAETGNASKIMNNGFIDWNQGVGIVNPPIVRSTNLSV